jgi:hypothetical protein|tara:strand:- start:291 stop:494 length:204 start_codon:yes stop_codon:yes gene_type:complete
MAEFQFIVNGELITYDKYKDIPEKFEHVIKFIPDIPEEPHTEEEHAELSLWNERLQKLMEKERARSN